MSAAKFSNFPARVQLKPGHTCHKNQRWLLLGDVIEQANICPIPQFVKIVIHILCHKSRCIPCQSFARGIC